MALRSSGNDEMLPISSVNKIDGRFYAILYTEPHIDYSDPSTRVTASGRGPSLGMGSRGKGSLDAQRYNHLYSISLKATSYQRIATPFLVTQNS
jgi:hypothetical protein